jgi:hypothetical protein
MWHNRYVSPNAYTAWLMPFSLKSFTFFDPHQLHGFLAAAQRAAALICNRQGPPASIQHSSRLASS